MSDQRPSQSRGALPAGYEAMIRRARVAVYLEALDRYGRRLVTRMVREGWLVEERGSWSGEVLYRASAKAVRRAL